MSAAVLVAVFDMFWKDDVNLRHALLKTFCRSSVQQKPWCCPGVCKEGGFPKSLPLPCQARQGPGRTQCPNVCMASKVPKPAFHFNGKQRAVLKKL